MPASSPAGAPSSARAASGLTCNCTPDCAPACRTSAGRALHRQQRPITGVLHPRDQPLLIPDDDNRTGGNVEGDWWNCHRVLSHAFNPDLRHCTLATTHCHRS
jgi:hypothetical protein